MVKDIKEINKLADNGELLKYIDEYEAEFTGKIEALAKEIKEDLNKNRIILISGPSGSGKTTFTLKLEDMLDNMGLEAFTVSLDDFFLSKGKGPIRSDGKPDFESVNALDLPLIKKCFNELIENGISNMPRFNFITGESIQNEKMITLHDNSVVLVEGMHALSNKIMECMPAYATLKIYISIMETLKDDDEVVLSSNTMRLMRRMVRDSKYRGAGAEQTLTMWLDVVVGDILHVIPFESRADIKINSFFPYEAGVLKNYIVPLISKIKEDSIFYDQCRDILERLKLIADVDEDLVPETSLIREFFGGSIYYNNSKKH